MQASCFMLHTCFSFIAQGPHDTQRLQQHLHASTARSTARSTAARRFSAATMAMALPARVLATANATATAALRLSGRSNHRCVRARIAVAAPLPRARLPGSAVDARGGATTTGTRAAALYSSTASAASAAAHASVPVAVSAPVRQRLAFPGRHTAGTLVNAAALHTLEQVSPRLAARPTNATLSGWPLPRAAASDLSATCSGFSGGAAQSNGAGTLARLSLSVSAGLAGLALMAAPSDAATSGHGAPSSGAASGGASDGSSSGCGCGSSGGKKKENGAAPRCRPVVRE